jgi:hypothetical protein
MESNRSGAEGTIHGSVAKRSRARALWTQAGFKFMHQWQKRRAHRTEMANSKQSKLQSKSKSNREGGWGEGEGNKRHSAPQFRGVVLGAGCQKGRRWVKRDRVNKVEPAVPLQSCNTSRRRAVG